MGKLKNVCKILIGKPEGRDLSGDRHRKTDDFKMDPKDEGGGGGAMHSVHLVQGEHQCRAFVNMAVHIWVT
jgi:hypothetical protein